MYPPISNRTSNAAVLAASLALGLTGCLNQETAIEKAPDKAYVFVVTSDYKTGSYSLVGLDSAFTRTNIDAISSDAAVRYLGGDDIFIINRKGRDNLQIVDKRNLKTVLPIALPPLSNPYDVEVRDGLIYVAMLAYDSILIFNQKDGTRAGGIDIHPYADNTGFAEAAALQFVDGTLYALLQNLDSSFQALPNPKLLKIDAKSKTIIKTLDLPLTNPLGITLDKSGGKLHIPCVGVYLESDFTTPVKDGGFVTVDLASFTASVTATETELGGNVGQALFHGGKLIFALGVKEAERLVAMTVPGNTLTDIVELGAWETGGMDLDTESNSLCLGDKKKGLRLFDLDTFKERDHTNIDLGLPPNGLAVIR